MDRHGGPSLVRRVEGHCLWLSCGCRVGVPRSLLIGSRCRDVKSRAGRAWSIVGHREEGEWDRCSSRLGLHPSSNRLHHASFRRIVAPLTHDKCAIVVRRTSIARCANKGLARDMTKVKFPIASAVSATVTSRTARSSGAAIPALHSSCRRLCVRF